jgi:hypothetical protein
MLITPIASFIYGLNLEKRIMDNIWFEVDNNGNISAGI